MKKSFFIINILALSIISCKNETKPAENITPVIAPEIEFQNKAHELVYNMVEKTGTYEDLKALKDVDYIYTYTTPDGKTDSVNEKYIFEGELSYAKYLKHERTASNLEGSFEQGFDGTNFWQKHEGNYMKDSNTMKSVTFKRKTNFYWFTMMQKLTDPGLNYELLDTDTLDGSFYDVVKVSFKSQAKPTDIYQLYINKKTNLVDQFLFTVADYGKMDALIMKVEYEKIDGILIPTKRKYTKGNWEGENINDNWIAVNWTHIKFNTGISKSLFEEKI